MTKPHKFDLDKYLYGKIYRYVDQDGNHGNIHLSTSRLTPLECVTTDNERTFIILDNEAIAINSLQELDSINNALNNYHKSIKVYHTTPSKELAIDNPELHIKTLKALRVALQETKITKRKFEKMNIYEQYDFIARKIDKIKKCVRLNQNKKIKEDLENSKQ